MKRKASSSPDFARSTANLASRSVSGRWSNVALGRKPTDSGCAVLSLTITCYPLRALSRARADPGARAYRFDADEYRLALRPSQ
jgi:hypothetical protein